MIEFDCPYCQRHLHVPNDLGGRRAPCPQCKQTLRIPEVDEVVAPSQPVAPAPPPPEPAPTPAEPTPAEPPQPAEAPSPEPPPAEPEPEPEAPAEPEPEPEPIFEVPAAPEPQAEPEPTIEAADDAIEEESPAAEWVEPAEEPAAIVDADEVDDVLTAGPEPAEPEMASSSAEGPTLDLEELIAAEQTDAADDAPPPAEPPSRPAEPPQAKPVRAAVRRAEPSDESDADDASAETSPARGFDAAALILGIVAVLCSPLGYVSLVPAALATAFGTMGLSPKRRTSRKKGKAVAGLALAAVGGLLSVMTATDMVSVVPTLKDHRAKAQRRLAALQLQEIGQALVEYAFTHNGQFAPDLQALVDEDLLEARKLTYPGLNTGRVRDYFYLVPSLDSPPNVIVVCEHIDCGDPDERMFILFSGKLMTAREADFQLIAERVPETQAFFEALRAAEADIAGGRSAD